MKIFFVANRIPCETGKGDQIVSYKRIDYLAKAGFSVSGVCYGDMESKADFSKLTKLRGICKDVRLVKFRWFHAFRSMAFNSLVGCLPFQCSLYKSHDFENAVRLAISELRPDILYCVTVRARANITNWFGPLAVDLIDSYGLNFQRRAFSANFLTRLLFDWERFKVARYERTVAEAATLASVVSDFDREFIGIDKIRSIPLGIDLVPQDYRRCPVGIRLIFSGNMSYSPNIEAILWFVEKCWMDIKKLSPAAELYIVGKSPAKSVSRLHSASLGINVTGWVESISDLFRASSVAIAPMWSGSGMQFKILEAMAHNVPVVATTLGRGDIKVRDGVEIMLADSPKDFVSNILRLIENRGFNQMIGDNGLKYVLKHHQWDELNCRFFSELKGSCPLDM